MDPKFDPKNPACWNRPISHPEPLRLPLLFYIVLDAAARFGGSES